MAPSSPSADSDDGNDEDVYVVKRILSEAGTDEERVFLIEWEGYPYEESTWEPEANVMSKETLKAWQEEKLRQREGLSQPFDNDEFDRLQEKHNRRKRRHEKLGLPPQWNATESEDSGDSSSDQAEEAHVEVPDYEGIPSPKKSRQPRVKNNDPTFRDDDIVMNDPSDEVDAPPVERRRAQKAATELFTSEDQHRKESRPAEVGTGGSEKRVSANKASVVETPSATGYQGTANRAPAAPSAIAPRGRSVRGNMRTTGRGSLMTSTKPKARRSIENRLLNETRTKEAKAPQLFATKSMERRFELGARALADRPPAQLPRLINPAEYAGQTRIRKRGTAPVSAGSQSSQTPVSATAGQQPTPTSTAAAATPIAPMAPMAPMVSSPEALHPQEDGTAADMWDDAINHATEKSHRPHNSRNVSFGVEETGRDQPEKSIAQGPASEHSPTSTFRPLISPFGFTSSAPVYSPPAPSAPVRKVSLANYSAKQSGVAPKPISMDNQAQNGWGGMAFKSFLGDSQTQDNHVMLTFADADIQNISWGAAVHQLQGKDLTFNHICRSTDVDNFKSEFKPTLLARGRVTAAAGDDNKGQESIPSLVEYLRLNISGLLYNFESLNIIIYPTRCEEWKFIEFGLQPQQDGELSFFSFTTPSKMLCHSYNREAQDKMAKVNVNGYSDYDLLNQAVFRFNYQGLHQVDKKSAWDFFFLLFPNMTSPLAEHTAAWLRSSNKDCRIYTCQQPGSWNQFLGRTNNPQGGSLILHRKMIPLIPRYPNLQRFLTNGLNNVWCIDEKFPQGKYMTRLFPQGGVVCLTSGFLAGEPDVAMAFLNWFLPKREPRTSTGTWRLFVCHGVHKYLCDQAFGAVKRRTELLESLSSGLTDSQKEQLATGSGLSLKHCQDRLDLKEVIGRLSRPKNEIERDLDAVLQPENKRSLMVFADEAVKPSDDRGLLSDFAHWSTFRLNTFRKFIAIASKTSPEEYEAVVAQKSNSSGTKPPSGKAPRNGTSSKSPRKSRWKNNFTSVDGANDDLEAGEINSDEESDPDAFDIDMDPEALSFIAETGATPSEAAEFLERAKGNQNLAVKLYEIAEKIKGQGKAAADTSSAAGTLPAPISPDATKENAAIPSTASPQAAKENVAIPSTENLTTEDIVMEDAPPTTPETAPEAPQPTNSNLPSENNTEAQPSSQTSNAGITTESGTRFVPRSVRTSGTVRNELNIRPGYVPPEDKEVYKVRRGRSGSLGSASISRSRSGSRESGGARAPSPGGVLTPVTPATPGKDHRMEGVEGAGEEKKEGKLSSLEWYTEKKLKGEEWHHITVAGWEEAFNLLRVEYKKT
ncbi:hypothetical protein V492_06703 [Pseudogymnoascus sp. VKM F-4246]|nr:hypothetical protein V492_06703 [Pseudogymnoascus sp. VKM F-4246]